ncbi:MAG: chrB [Verrucomicrobiaceae bacterium]|nr:chrB [Verrucomicrobiaceae bacterium]
MDIQSWLLLINSVTGDAGSLRVRLWRQLKGMGAAALRDGAYLLPARSELIPGFDALRDELRAAGGTAYVVQVPPQEASLQTEWQVLFERSEQYQEWVSTLAELLGSLSTITESEARRALRQRRKDLDGIAAIDFFAGEALEQARHQYDEAERRLTRYYSPDEPLPATGDIQLLQRGDYQGRQWATRARPWVDRIASAWLIQRFIDQDARFMWLAKIADCPPTALGFDFDGATFTHIGERVTFEVLVASFGLSDDAGLLRLGALVHALDVDGEATPEGAGFEAILAGARTRLNDDDALLTEVSGTLDSLYAFFKSDTTK